MSEIKIWNSMLTPNSDGIDLTSCNNVAISNCDIRTGDDAIVIAGYAHHYELPGYQNIIHQSANFTITNCNLQSKSSGIRIGFIDQNNVRNIIISNINITNTNRGIGIFIRGEASIENITISNVFIETKLHTGDWWGNGEPIHISAVRGIENGNLGKVKNITLRNITCSGESGILLYGSSESIIENVFIDNLNFIFRNSNLNETAGGNIDLRGAYGENQLFSSDISAFYAQFIKNLVLNRVSIAWDNVKEKYFLYGIHIKEFENIELKNIISSPSPSNPNLPSVFIENGKGLITDINGKKIKLKNVQK